MAFNLTAELQLQANNQNINQVVNQIQSQLSPLGNVSVKVNANTKSISQAANQVQRLDKGLRSSQKSASELNRTLVESARRFSVITVATGSLLSLVNAFKNSVKSALDFEVELAKISQVTGKTVKGLSDLSGEVRKLSRELGVGNAELLNTSRILLQTGLSAEKTKNALDVLARTTLAATFENIQDTTEGAIALLNQFGGQARRTGQDIAFLEENLDAINAVSKKFAVESSDLIGVVRRVGGVFSAAGGDVKELIALFTSVRQTTRESAETISTGLRTIFTRLQRTDTVDALRDLNIELQDSKGQFVGAFEAVKRLSVGLSALDPKDFRFSQIVEELGGFRQVGKVIPLIKQFSVAQNALNVAQNSSGSIVRDSITAQKTLANRFAKTREKFDELIAQFADSSTFRSLANGFLVIADSLIKIGSALEPVLPLLTALFALKLGSGLASGIGLLRGFGGGGGGGAGPIVASRFATGGPVPGSGSRDTVPAMLTPGEFVIRKSSVKKIGMNNLAQMNAKGYASGGSVANFKSGKPYVEDPITTLRKNKNKEFNAGEGSSRKKATRFNSSDTLDFQVVREDFDVNKVDKRIKESRDYFNAETTSKRGDAFERVVEKSLKLQRSSQASSRLDARKGSKVFEFKSTLDQTSESAIGEKLLGAALNPIGSSKDPDAIAQARLTDSNSLTENPNTVNLGKVNLIQDGTTGADGRKLGQGTKKTKDAVNEARKQNFKATAKNNFFGGMIQKFAAGGAVESILKQNQVGAANLDVGKNSDVKLGVSVAKVNATDTVKNNNFLKNKAGVRKYLNSQGKSAVPSYTLKRKSLDKTTGDKFTTSVVDELIKGFDNASGALGQDLIGQPVKASDQAKNAIKNKLGAEGGVIGDGFEIVLNTVANKGDFAPSNLFQPFDFPNGIQPPLADNFSGLPSSFVDSRKAQSSKDKGSFEKKVANQIALEAAASQFGQAPTKAQKKMLGGMIKKFARGGSAGGDTVPAMLTPGEFVLNKKAAGSIGAAKLNAMNKRGEVQGFNKGGAVQYLNAGGRPRGGQFGLSGQTFDPNAFGGVITSVQNVEEALARVGVSAETFANEAAQVEQILRDGGTEAQAFNVILDKLADGSNEAKEAAKSQAAEQEALRNNPTGGNTVASDENLSSAQNIGNNAAVGTTSVQAVTAAAGNSEDLRAQLEAAQKEEITAITREIRQRDQNIGIAEAKARAEKVVENAYGTLAKNIEVRKTVGQKLLQSGRDMLKATKDRIKALNSSRKTLQNQIKQSFREKGTFGALRAGAGRVGGAIGSGLNKGATAAAQGLGGAQNLAFAGAAIGGVVASLGLFEDATNKAAAQAIAFGTTTIGLIATVAQTVASFTASSAAATAEAIASAKAGVADEIEAKSSLGAAGVIGIFTIAVVAAVSVLYFWSAQAKAQAEQASKEFDKAFKDIENGARGAGARLKNAASKEVRARAEAAKFAPTNNKARLAIGALTGAVAGAAIALAPFTAGLSVVAGALLGAAAGVAIAVAGTAGAFGSVESALNAEQQALVDEIAARNKAIDGLVALTQAVAQSKDVFEQIEGTLGLKDQKNDDGFSVATLRKQAQTEKDVLAAGQDSNIGTQRDAEKVLQDISLRTGQSVAALRDLNAEDLAKAIRKGDQRNVTLAQKAQQQGPQSGPAAKALDDNLKAAQKRRGAGDTAIFEAAIQFKTAILSVEKRSELLEKNLKESGTQLSSLLAEAPVDAAFKDLIAEGTAIGKAFKIRVAALEASAREETRLDKEAIAALEKKARVDGSLSKADADALAGIKKGISERKAVTDKQIKEELEFAEKTQNARNENAIAIREEAKVRAEIIKALRAQEVALASARQALLDAQNINAGVQFDISALSDGPLSIAESKLDVESPIPEKVIANVKEFGKSLGNLTAKQQKQAQGAIDQVISSQNAASTLFDSLAGQETPSDLGGTADQILGRLLPDEKDIDGFLLSAFGNSQDLVNQFKEGLRKAGETGGVLDPDEVKKLIDPIKQAGSKAGETLVIFNDVINTQTKKTELILQRENAIRSKNLEALSKFNEQLLKGADVIADAQGKDPNEGKSDRILAASQRRLNAGQAGRGGLALDASDSQGLAQIKRGATIRKKLANIEIKVLNNRIAAGEKLSQADQDRLTELQVARQKEINIIKDVTEAQEAQISSLDSQIAIVAKNLKESAEAIKKSKEQTFAAVSEFVIGGKETRKALNDGAAGIAQALRTGTIQNQSEEQRSKTISLLDKLSDVQIGNTGLTGKEIKQELIFRDAIKLGFPPEIAKELATSTTVEENMLEQLKKLVEIQNTIAEKEFQAATSLATGGQVPLYRNNGGSIFQPKGTDTVPAMLTPGEFVIRKSAVDKVGAGALNAINQGQPLYRANGSNNPEKEDPFAKLLAKVSKTNLSIDASNAFGQKNFENQANSLIRSANETQDDPFAQPGLPKIALPPSKDTFGISKGRLQKKKKKRERDPYDFVEGFGDDAQSTTAKAIEVVAAEKEEIERDRIERNKQLFEDKPFKAPALPDDPFMTEKDKRGQDLFLNPKTEKSLLERSREIMARNKQKRLEEDPFLLNKKNTGESDIERVRRERREEAAANEAKRENGRKEFDALSPKEKEKATGGPKLVSTKEERERFELYESKIRKKQEDYQLAQNNPKTADDPFNFDKNGNRIGGPKTLSYGDALRQTVDEEVDNARAIAAQKRQKEEARNIAANAYAEAKAQGFSEKYSISAGFRAVDAAKIEKTPASGDTPAEYYGRDDVIKVVEEGDKKGSVDGKPSRLDRLKGFKTEQEAKAQAREESGSASSKKPSGRPPKSFETPGLNKAGKRRISPQAQRARQRSQQGGSTPIGRQAAATRAFIDRAIAWGWATKSQADRQNFLFGEDSGYRNALRGKGSLNGPAYYAYAQYAISKVLEQQQEADSGPEAAKLPPTTNAKQANEAKAQQASRQNKEAKNRTPSQGGQGSGSGGYGGSGSTPNIGQSSDPSLVLSPAAIKVDGSEGDKNLKRWQDRLNDPTVSEGGKRAARRAIRDYNRKQKPLPTGNSEADKKARREAQIKRSQAILDDPNASEGATRAAKQRIRDAERKNNPLDTLEKQREAARSRFNNRLAEGGSEGKRIAAERGLRDLDRVEAADKAAAAADKATATEAAVLESIEFNKQREADLGPIDSDLGPIDADLGDANATTNLGRDRKAASNFDEFTKNYRKDEQKELTDAQIQEMKRQAVGTAGFAKGGGVEGSDTIPAMLTPGEFVMSREAVQRNGVGYMRNLNKGIVQGFRRGGMVGTGNVRYRSGGSNDKESGGGGLSIDPSGIQQVLTDFSASFKEIVDNISTSFSGINTSLDNLTTAINGGMTVTHQFSGDMKMAFKIENGDQLKNSIAEALTPKISQIITDEMAKRLDGFQAGG